MVFLPSYYEDWQSSQEKCPDFLTTFGNKLVELARNDEKVVAISAAMLESTGLMKFKEYSLTEFSM